MTLAFSSKALGDEVSHGGDLVGLDSLTVGVFQLVAASLGLGFDRLGLRQAPGVLIVDLVKADNFATGYCEISDGAQKCHDCQGTDESFFITFLLLMVSFFF
jgi:hypothetical protein